MRRPLGLFILLLLLFVTACSGVPAGVVMVAWPSGSGLGMNAAMLSHSAFSSFLIPGLLLTCFIGLFPVLIFVGLIWTPTWHWLNTFNLYPDRHWSWTFSLYQGIVMGLWICVQQFMVPFFWLQPVVALVGVAIIICTMTPGVMRYAQQRHEQPVEPPSELH